MGVLNWMQNKLHGSHRSRRKSEFSTRSARLVGESRGLALANKLNDGSTGIREGKSCGRFHELSKLKELKSVARGRGADTADELGSVHHLQLERLRSCSSSTPRNGGIVRPRSFTILATAFDGFQPRSSFRRAVPEVRFNEIIWGLLLEKAHPENPAFSDTATRDDQAVQMVRKGEAKAQDEGGKWIRTDSEYIVLEI